MFWSKEAYDITKKITRNNELHVDLVSHVYLLLHQLDIPADELPKTFSKFAFNQWNWKQSEFNRQYQRGIINHELPDCFSTSDQEDFSEHEDMLIRFLEKPPADDTDLFCKEIAKMHLYGMTYRDIRNDTDLSLQVIHQAIKQFKYDLYNHYHHTVLNRTSQSTNDFQSTKLQATELPELSIILD
jgi:hypothetical protein